MVSGEVDPPANPLVVPQFCFRSNDIDNVGITGRHYTGFIMVGQHAFTAPDEYDQDRYFRDMLDWVVEGMGIPKRELVLHEDAWGGGGNLGACMEFFVNGLELFNQVYMFYAVDPSTERGYRELDTTVLDMGMGLERIVWITHGSETSYEANMPGVVERLYEATGVDPDRDVWQAFLPHAGALNLDEADDIDATWRAIADDIGVDVDALQDEVLPAAHLYAVADHARCLLVALHDGLLPSNAGERHALRVMARRCFEFIDRYGWDITLDEVVAWHADEFGELYPELQDNVADVRAIVRHEREKYDAMLDDAERLIDDLDDVSPEELVELYDSHGITPEMLQRRGVDVDVPEDFYTRVAARHVEEGIDAATEEGVDVSGIEQTERLYWDDQYLQDFEAEVVAVVDGNGVVLDRTAFYPTSGGQEHDTGVLDGADVVDVEAVDGVIVHRVDGAVPDVGETVAGSVDWERRTRLRTHHTATHIVNAVAREVLGSHVWQAGSHKSEEKGRLDITHYEQVDRETLQQIEDRANELVADDLPVETAVLQRTEAERRHGFRLYQGGAVPGNEIRVVSIDDVDAEACGGTHVRSTGAVGTIRLTDTSKVQDGTIRLEYVAGPVAAAHDRYRAELEGQLRETVDVDRSLEAIADIFDVEVSHLPRVVRRFAEEWQERKEELDALREAVEEPDEHVAGEYGERPRDPQRLFDEWKRLEKDVKRLEAAREDAIREQLVAADDGFLQEHVDTGDIGMLIRIARQVVGERPGKAVLLVGKNAAVGARGEENDRDMTAAVGRYAETVQGDEAFAKGFQLRE